MKGMKTGGRQKGTPNKAESPITVALRRHSMEYFTPDEALGGRSQFDLDIEQMTPEDRAQAEIRIVEFHTPRKKAVDVQSNVSVNVTIEDTLRHLCGGELVDDEDDE